MLQGGGDGRMLHEERTARKWEIKQTDAGVCFPAEIKVMTMWDPKVAQKLTACPGFQAQMESSLAAEL